MIDRLFTVQVAFFQQMALKSTRFQYTIFWSIAWLLSYERTNLSNSVVVHVVVWKFYWETDKNEKYWIKNTGMI